MTPRIDDALIYDALIYFVRHLEAQNEMGFPAIVFFVVALASAFIGFGVDSDLAGPFKLLFFVSCTLFYTKLIVDKLKSERI